jgi:hypothetical protein
MLPAHDVLMNKKKIAAESQNATIGVLDFPSIRGNTANGIRPI